MPNTAPIFDYPALSDFGAKPATGSGGAFAYLLATNASALSIPNNATTLVGGAGGAWSVAASPPDQNVGGVAGGTAPFNTASGVFTAPNSGTYLVQAQLQFAANAAAPGNQFRIELFRAAISSGVLGAAAKVFENSNIAESNTNISRSVAVNVAVLLNAGDTLQINAFQDTGGAIALTASALDNWLAISQVA
jgi:hypothetical protein